MNEILRGIVSEPWYDRNDNAIYKGLKIQAVNEEIRNTDRDFTTITTPVDTGEDTELK